MNQTQFEKDLSCLGVKKRNVSQKQVTFLALTITVLIRFKIIIIIIILETFMWILVRYYETLNPKYSYRFSP